MTMFPYKFEVGEVAIVIAPGQSCDGAECIITHPLQFVRVRSINVPYCFDKGMMYGTVIAGIPRIMWAFPWELRKKRPPDSTVDTVQQHSLEAV